MTALHRAVAAGNAAAIQMLLPHGAHIKAKDTDGASALHLSNSVAASR